MNASRFNIFDYHRRLEDEGIFFCFRGPISQDLLNYLIKHLVKKEKFSELSPPRQKRVFSSLIELIQNILHYSSDSSVCQTSVNDTATGIVVMGCNAEHYFISCGNKIENKNIDALNDKLSQVQDLSKEELKALYLKERNCDEVKSEKGAGLGFIELARKSTHPIEYDITKIDQSSSYFTITSKI